MILILQSKRQEDMAHEQLTAISPLDGRYAEKTSELTEIFSEYGLIRFRVEIEIRWLQMLSNNPDIIELDRFDKDTNNQLNDIIDNFNTDDAKSVKDIERTTNHDVKAVEYFICQQFKDNKNINDFITIS